MVRKSVVLDEALDMRLKLYCIATYRGQSFGKQETVIRSALVEYLDRHEKKQEAAQATPESKALDNADIKRIWDTGERSPTEIAKQLGAVRTTVIGRIDSMKKKGEITE